MRGAERASKRQKKGKRLDLPERLPEGCKPGDARDIAAEKVGMSGRHAEAAKACVMLNRDTLDRSKDGKHRMRSVMALSIRPEHLAPDNPVEPEPTLVCE
ncbi:MAG: hypothetical protein K0U90_08465 [Planctomycetes bacterium]|nr:hypothetical protein [Planctomycetota bacterium]